MSKIKLHLSISLKILLLFIIVYLKNSTLVNYWQDIDVILQVALQLWVTEPNSASRATTSASSVRRFQFPRPNASSGRSTDAGLIRTTRIFRITRSWRTRSRKGSNPRWLSANRRRNTSECTTAASLIPTEVTWSRSIWCLKVSKLVVFVGFYSKFWHP